LKDKRANQLDDSVESCSGRGRAAPKDEARGPLYRSQNFLETTYSFEIAHDNT